MKWARVFKAKTPVFLALLLALSIILPWNTIIFHRVSINYIAHAETNTTIYLPVTVYSYDTGSGSYTFRITIDSSAPPEFWRYVSHDGSDIYVTKNNTPVYYYIESFNLIDRKLVLWIHDDDYRNGSTYEIHFGEGTNPYSNYNDPSKVFLLYDDFETLDTSKWTSISGTWSSDGEYLYVSSDYDTTPGNNIIYTAEKLDNVVIEANFIYNNDNGYNDGVIIYCSGTSTTSSWYQVGVSKSSFQLVRYDGSSWSTLQSVDISDPTGKIVKITITISNGEITATYNSNSITYTASSTGYVGLHASVFTSTTTRFDWIRVYQPFNVSYTYRSVVLSGLPAGEISNRQYLEFYLVPGAVNEVWYDPSTDTFSIHYFPAPGVSIAFGSGDQALQPTTRYSKYYIYGYTTGWAYNFYVYDQPDQDLYHEHAAGYFEMNDGNKIRIYGYDTTYDNGWVQGTSYTATSPATLEYSPNYDGNGHGKLAVESGNGLSSVYTTTSTNWNYGLEYADDLDYWSISTSSSTDGDLGINRAEVIYLRFKTPGVVYHNTTIKYIGDPNTYVLDPSADIIKINAEWKPGRIHPTIFVEYTYNVTRAETTIDPGETSSSDSYVENTFGGDFIPVIIVLVLGLFLAFFIGEKGLYIVVPILVYYSRNGVVSAWIGVLTLLGLFLFIVYRSGMLKISGGEE